MGGTSFVLYLLSFKHIVIQDKNHLIQFLVFIRGETGGAVCSEK